jgi:hypothetical protein
MHVLDRGVKAVARGAARLSLNVHGRGARTDAFGHSFAVLSTHFSAAGLRLRLVDSLYNKIASRGKNLGVMGVKICVSKLAKKNSDCAVRISAVIPL